MVNRGFRWAVLMSVGTYFFIKGVSPFIKIIFLRWVVCDKLIWLVIFMCLSFSI